MKLWQQQPMGSNCPANLSILRRASVPSVEERLRWLVIAPWLWVCLLLVLVQPSVAAILWSDLGEALAHDTGDGHDILGGAVKRDNTATDTLYFKFHVDPLSDVSTEEYFAGFELFEGDTRRLAVGNATKAWAYSAFHTSEKGEFNKFSGDYDLHSSRPESTAVGVFKQYEQPRRGIERTVVFKVEYMAGGDDLVTVWLSPDLGSGVTESDQPQALTTKFKADCSFDEIHLRHGGGGGGWTFSDMAIATSFNDFVAGNAVDSGKSAGRAASSFLFRSWQREQGMPQNLVRALAQSRAGYLWIGTDGGVARFDGVRFVSFGAREGLQCGPVSRIFEDSRGVVWIGSVNGGMVRWQNGKFITFTVKDGLPSDSITTLAEDNDGRLWVGTKAGLAVRQEEKWIQLSGIQSFEGKPITALFNDAKGAMWVCAKDAGIFQFQNGAFKPFKDSSVDKLLQDPHCLLVDRSGRLWVGAGDDFVLCREGEQWRRYRIPRHLDKPYITSLAESPDGTVWAGSVSEGLFQFKDGKLAAINAGSGMLDNFIESLFVDREGNLWVGTSAGLNQLRPKSVSFFGPEEGIGYGAVQGMAEIAPGVVWAGKSSDGLYRWQGRSFSRLNLAGLSRNEVQVSAVLPTRDGSCWVASSQGLVHIENPKADSVGTQPAVLLELNAISLTEDREGALWVGTREGEIWRIQDGGRMAQTNLWQSRPITSIMPGADGSMWIGTDGDGLHRYQDRVHSRFGKTNGLLSDSIRALHQSSDGTLWIGTAGGGLARWQDSHFALFTTREGLPDDTVSQILEDDTGRLWLGGNRGIVCLSKTELGELAAGRTSILYPRVYGRSDGMLSEECTGGFCPAGLKAKNGWLWFSTLKGAVVIDPHLKKIEISTPTVVLEDVVMDGAPIIEFRAADSTARAGEMRLNSNETSSAMLRIPPGKHRIEFRYTGLSYTAPEQVRFRYRLEGLDSDWVEAGTRRSAFYSYVPPGEHRFRVIACNTDGVWSEPGDSLAFAVLPHFWQTWWFIGAVVLGFFILVGGTIRFVEKRKVQNRLKQLERERTLERERARIAQDLHDDLGASLSRISLLSDMAKAGQADRTQTGAHVAKISQLATQTLRALDEIVWAVRPGSDSLQSVVEYIAHFANELFRGNGVRCRLDLPDNLPVRPLPPEMRHNIFLIAKEALTNAFKHAAAHEIFVQIKTTGTTLDLLIQDDGQGFDTATVQSERDGNGLDNMRHRAEAIGAKLQMDSMPGKGTTVRLSVDFASNGRLLNAV